MPSVNSMATSKSRLAFLSRGCGLLILLAAGGCMTPIPAGDPQARTIQGIMRHSIVKIHTTIQSDDFSLPWQASRPSQGSGTGFVVGERRILTNAHVVSNARFIEVQKNGDPRRFVARVRFAGHDCDLAVLEVDDASFFDNTRPVAFADDIPGLGETVIAIGFPLGGSRVSITRGVVSRIDYSVYSHSAVDHHLVLQVDAAINPGNSGGPILFGGNVVGVAFQGLSVGDNIGYAIPTPVVRHFLDDIADGVYNGYPELGVEYMELRNPAMRAHLHVPDGETGVVVASLDPFGSAAGHLETGDVLLEIDGYDIGEDGTVDLDGTPVDFNELLERRQWGDAVDLRLLRRGEVVRLPIPLTNPPDPFAFRNLYDVKPDYVVAGGLVFAPLTREILKTLRGGFASVNEHRLLYLSRYAKRDGHYRDQAAFIILIRRLPHPVNTYADPFLLGRVLLINDVAIRSLGDVRRAFDHHDGEFHVIRFEGTDDPLVLDARLASSAERSILGQYGVPSPFHIKGEVQP